MIRVKICGVREVSHALAALEAGADLIGLVFAPSSRHVGLAKAQEIAHAVRKRSASTEIVGVFVNAPLPEVNHIAICCPLDRVQLSGDESPEYCLQLGRPIIKAFHVRDLGSVRRELEAWIAALSGRDFLPLLDSRTPESYGGTGVAFDWELARPVARSYSVILAGGLTPENVGRAVQSVSPWGVDVSSGVEIDGVKSPARVRAFMAAARSADVRAGCAVHESMTGRCADSSPRPS